MKRLFTSILFLFFVANVFSQAPNAFKFQTMIRDVSGEVLPLQDLTLKFLIHINTPDGEVIYEEQHLVATNSVGLVNVNIGNGEVLTGLFNEINWASGSYFLEEQIDIGNTGQFQVFGTVQLLSVPYALHSNKSQGIQSMTTEERNEIEDPPVGMQIYNSDTKCLNYFTGDQWYETCGECSPQPTQAFAGEDQIGIEESWIVLQANQPLSGIGQWSIYYGEGGEIQEVNNPNSVFTGQANTQYILMWEITTECGSSIDQVIIEFGTYDFACGDTLLDERDQQKYGTVIIGNQCWFSQNMNIGERIDSDVFSTDNGVFEKYCYYDTDSTCNIHGGLYLWNEAMQYEILPESQGICPQGWHIPSDSDWHELFNMYGGIENAGGPLKQAGDIQSGTGLWCDWNTGATNESGFTAIPTGYFYVGENFDDWLTFWGFYKTSTTALRNQSFACGSELIQYTWSNFTQTGAVRCIKD